MSERLLSLLTEIELALIANGPPADGGTWESMRLINFPQGLARLALSLRPAGGMGQPAGTILLQGFTLADGAICLKATLAWQGVDQTVTSSIFAKPGINWRSEASQIAIQWLDGQPASVESLEDGDETPDLQQVG